MDQLSSALRVRPWLRLPALLALVWIVLHVSPVFAQEAEDDVPAADQARPPMVVEDDLFEAGSSVDLRAEVQGDLFAAGGWVELAVEVADNLIAAGAVLDAAGRVDGDFIVTGGLLDLVAEVGDNLVAAGGIVDVDGLIGRKLFASAVRLKVGHNALIAGDAWLAAASADVAGTIEGNARLAGGTVTVRGRIKGDVETTAISLTLAESAIIGGRLIHRGPEPPDLAEGATVNGGIEHAYEPKPADEPDADPSAGELPPLLWLLIILVLGLVLDLLVPGYLRGSEGLMIRHPFASFGLGLAILFTTPVVIVILMVSVLGFALGLAALATYG
ncbi:MAG: polymer-forming cytoskeletal protein, partial [Geminicoccaceae bacterium]|nr:polymer-forming cytoskeletal protein [Geminicoccaceae bacterium]